MAAGNDQVVSTPNRENIGFIAPDDRDGETCSMHFSAIREAGATDPRLREPEGPG